VNRFLPLLPGLFVLLSSCEDSDTDPYAAPAQNSQPPAGNVAETPPQLPVNRIAPDGTFFVKERIKVESDAGIYIVHAGTEVRFVSREPQSVKVTNGEVTFEVSESQLTNNQDEREAILVRERSRKP